MTKTLYDYWFVQFDFPDENGQPYRTNGGEMKYCKTLRREVPKLWEIKPLPEVASLQYGFPLSTELFSTDGANVVRIRDIMDNSISALTNEKVGNEYLTRENDLLVGMDGNFQMNYWTRNGDVVNQRITRIRKKELSMMLVKMQIEPYITAKVATVARSTVGHLGDADFSNQLILVPDKLDTSVFDVILDRIISLRKENHQLADLRDWLLPMLMNGQAKVMDAKKEETPIVEETTASTDDPRFENWLNTMGLAARGTVDRQTMHDIFNAMDEDDKQ